MPSFIVRLPGFIKLIIFLFVLLYPLFWLKSMALGLKIDLFSKGYLRLAFLGFYSSLWWLSNLATKWRPILLIGGLFVKILDQGWSETFGPQGVYNKISEAAMTSDKATYIGFRKLIFGYLITVMLV